MAVHPDFKIRNAGHRALVHYNFIQGFMRSHTLSVSQNLAVQHRTEAQFIIAGRVNFLQCLFNLFSPNFCQETQRT